MKELTLKIQIGPGAAMLGLAALLLAGGASELSSESLTLTTYYPAPSGIYNTMVTTQSAFLARSSGSVVIGPSAGAPKATLEVNGTARFSDTTAGCAPDNEGAVRYNKNAHKLEVCDNTGWTSGVGGLGGAAATYYGPFYVAPDSPVTIGVHKYCAMTKVSTNYETDFDSWAEIVRNSDSSWTMITGGHRSLMAASCLD